MTERPEMALWLSDARGIYIPRDFAASFANRAATVSGVTEEDWAILDAGPDHEFYWDAWSDVCDNATITMEGVEYSIHQDGDCWLVPDGMEWSDREETFVWPEEAEAEDGENDDAA
jgi:hypothetical protein